MAILSKYFNIKIIGLLVLASITYSCKNKDGNQAVHPFCASDYCSDEGKEELINLYQNNKTTEKIINFEVNCIVTSEKSPEFFKISEKIKALNQIFFPARIQFQLRPIISHKPVAVNLDEIESKKSARNLVARNLEKKDALNIFIVPHGEYLNGFTYVIQENFLSYFNILECNTTFISDKAWFNESTLAHEIGHFFGLQHTFGKSPYENTTLEKPDGSNCVKEGDFICDTAADPNGKINKKCEYVGLSDAKKYDFNPPVNNFMSYYPNKCKNEFTAGQYASMNAFANKYRKYLSANK
ncbi:MAG: hypothetical protein IBX66_00255 [Lutibacter sp.]|nr:hypothetical protein [Lutibacter sp.]